MTTTKAIDTGASIFEKLKNQGFNDIMSKFITSQSAFETADFNSKIFKENNNAFGMKYAGQMFAAGEKNGYANYLNVDDSVSDFVKWYNKHRQNIFSLPLIIFTLADYVRFLKNNNYFEALESSYLAGVQSYYNLYYG